MIIGGSNVILYIEQIWEDIMLSKKKIKIMFCMADYENSDGKKDLRTVKLYKNDYIRINMLLSIVCVTIAYALILALIVLYNLEYIISNAVSIHYYSVATLVLGIYVLLIIFYSFVSIYVFSKRYDISKKRVKKYFRYLKYLNTNYQKDDTDNSSEVE